VTAIRGRVNPRTNRRQRAVSFALRDIAREGCAVDNCRMKLSLSRPCGQSGRCGSLRDSEQLRSRSHTMRGRVDFSRSEAYNTLTISRYVQEAVRFRNAIATRRPAGVVGEPGTQCSSPRLRFTEHTSEDESLTTALRHSLQYAAFAARHLGLLRTPFRREWVLVLLALTSIRRYNRTACAQFAFPVLHTNSRIYTSLRADCGHWYLHYRGNHHRGSSDVRKGHKVGNGTANRCPDPLNSFSAGWTVRKLVRTVAASRATITLI